MGLFFIGLGEFACLLLFAVGIVWLILNIFRRKSKKKPIITAVSSIVVFLVLVGLSGTFYSEEMEQQQIEREVKEAEERAIRESIKNVEMAIEESKLVETAEETELRIKEESTEKTMKSEKETIESETEEQTTEQKTESEISEDDKLMADLSEILNRDVADKLCDILINQIGFVNVKYLGKNAVGTMNYDFASERYNFTVTVSDDVYRVFQSSGGFVFYEDGEVKNTISDVESKTINRNDRSAYYFMAQQIVEAGLKNPGSADFPSIVTRPEEIAMSKKDDVVAVQSWVEAKNSFDAKVRSQWIVEFRVIDLDTYSYEPIYLSVDGEVLFGEYLNLD